MTRRVSALLAILTLLALAGPAGAQDSGLQIESIDVDEHPLVALTVTGETQLVGENPEFVIRENGQQRQLNVRAAASDDLTVVLAVDVSGSMQGAPLAAAKEAVTQFINQMPPGVQMSIISFGNAPALAAEFTEDRATLLTAVDLLAARGETALYDGLSAASALLELEEQDGRTIVLVSDGGDTVSTSSLDGAIADLEALQTRFYAVELQSPENDRAALDALAGAAGGIVIPADDPEALAVSFGEVASELLSSYRLVFASETFGTATVQVEVVQAGTTIAQATRTLDFPLERTISTLPEPEAPVTSVTIPPLRTGTAIELSWLESTTARWIGVGALFAALATVFIILALRPRSPRGSRPAWGSTSSSTLTPNKKSTALTVIAESATSLAEQTLERGERLKSVNSRLERAGVALRPGEFLVLVVSAALAAAAIGVVLLTPLIGLVLALVLILIVPMWLSSKASARSAMFNDQLGDTLQLMSASMRAGYGLLQAIDAVAEEALSPTAEEFQRIKIETHLGRDLDEALNAAADRVGSEDFRWVAEAIEIHRQIGGDLAEILDAVAETIRDRNRIRRRIKALSAEGRISAVILSLIPLVLAIVIFFINPSYIGELPATGFGQVLIVLGVVAWVVAVGWMRRIVQLRF